MSNLIAQIENKRETIKRDIETMQAFLDVIDEKLSFTLEFLQKMGAVGYTKVSVGKKHRSVPSSDSWPFNHGDSVFGFVPKYNEATSKTSNRGWPPIWGVVEQMGISKGAGNSHQHQADTTNLIDGVYHLKKGQWVRIDD